MGIVIGRAENLAAGDVLERRGNAAGNAHVLRVDDARVVAALEGGAIGAQQEHGLVRGALALLEGQGRIPLGVEARLAHHAVDEQAHLLLDHLEVQVLIRAAPIVV